VRTAARGQLGQRRSKFVSERLVVSGDAAATAANLLAHKGLFQLGFAVFMIEMACNSVITALFYDLLKPVSRSVSLGAAFLGLAGCVIKTMSRLFFIAPLFIRGGAHYLSVFSAEQLQALALLFLKVNDRGAAIALVFFGFYALLTGYLIIRSTFLPRILGVLSVFENRASDEAATRLMTPVMTVTWQAAEFKAQYDVCLFRLRSRFLRRFYGHDHAHQRRCRVAE
jgi:hypothetical protein